jgi:DNA helicase-2/ATP-dependent DNA helicase PcrA
LKKELKKEFIETLGLNKEQLEAVLAETPSQLVFAGAGTGKTKVLTAKIAWLIKERNIHPSNIFAATFTNKAAKEMKERISKLIGIPCDNLWIGTFHSLCVKILRRESEKIGYSRYFSIYDSGDQNALMKRVMKESLVDEKTLQPKAVLNIISSFKNRSISVEKAIDTASAFYEKEMAQLYQAYQNGLKSADAMDFDDLIYNVVDLFKKSPETAIEYQNIFRHILLDEYQDTNGVQSLLVKALAGESTPIFAVGDDDQSIYGWRGAEIENILNFEKNFPGCSIHKLEQNYRSTKPILDFANAAIANNTKRSGKKLWTNLKSSEEVIVRAYADDRKEGSGICSEIANLISSDGVSPGSIAILFRTNAQSRLFEDGFRKKNVPYVLVGGTSFYERKEIKDVLAYIKLLVNPKDDVSCQRVLNVPLRGVGARSQEKISIAAKKRGLGFFELIQSGEAEAEISGKAKKGVSRFRETFGKLYGLRESGATPEQLLTEMLSETGYVDELAESGSEEARGRIENINELINAVAEWQEKNRDGSLGEFLEEITLSSSVDKWDVGEAVNLMTMHTAKGLEFDRVYLVGIEDGLIPARQNFDDQAKLEEECRLLYVGATRAEKKLTVSYAESRMRFGSIMPMGLSRFVKTIPTELYQLVDETAQFTTFFSDDEFSQPSYSKKRVSALNRRVIKKRAPATESVSQLPPSHFDEFNQDSVEYRRGQLVGHKKFGQGKILNISGFGTDMRITVLFEGGVRKQMIAKFAKLQVL